MGPEAGETLHIPSVSRGAAFGDVDNDGDTDVVVVDNNAAVKLLINNLGQDHSWLGLRLLGPAPQGDLLGATAVLDLADGRSLFARARTDGSFLSAHDPRLLFGLATRVEPIQVRVEWPHGQVEHYTGLRLGRYHDLRQGQGQAVPQ